MVKEQPAAYDVQEVLQGLYDNFVIIDGTAYVRLDVATDIVHKGGVNDEKDISCLTVAPRTNRMSKDDLNSIAAINRIALNLERMQRMLEE